MATTQEPFVTVISGLPRSGTSMMMMMVEAGGVPILTDQVRAADQENPRGYYELEAVKKTRLDASWVAGSVGKAVKVVHLLLYDLPVAYHYRVILMRRNLNEVLASQKTMLDRQGGKGANLSPQKLADVYRSQMEKLVTWLGEQTNFQVLEVNYGDVVGRPRQEAEQVNDLLGGTLDVDAMAAAVDPALYRQRK